MESFPAQIHAIRRKLSDDLRHVEFTGQWLDKETAQKHDHSVFDHITITWIYKNCFFAKTAIPMPYEIKLNGTLSDDWRVGDQVYCPFERYADDTVVHCKTEAQAHYILDKIRKRMKESKLELHPEKTKIVYCQDKDRTKSYECTEFDFLSYTFRKVLIKDRLGRLRFNFLASVSKKATKALNAKYTGAGDTQTYWYENRYDCQNNPPDCERMDELFWEI